jgi:hypothetical protein
LECSHYQYEITLGLPRLSTWLYITSASFSLSLSKHLDGDRVFVLKGTNLHLEVYSSTIAACPDILQVQNLLSENPWDQTRFGNRNFSNFGMVVRGIRGQELSERIAQLTQACEIIIFFCGERFNRWTNLIFACWVRIYFPFFRISKDFSQWLCHLFDLYEFAVILRNSTPP